MFTNKPRFLSFALCLMGMLILVACGGGEPPVSDPDDGEPGTAVEQSELPVPTEEPTTPPTEEPDPTPEPTVVPAEETPEETPKETPEETVEEVVEDTKEDPTAEPVEEPLSSAGEGGYACFGTPGHGLTCLTAEGEWVTYTQENSNLYINYVSSVDKCDGNLILGLGSSLSLFDGADFREFPDREDFGSNEAAACDDNGGIWVAHFKGVSYFDGTSWTTYDETYLGDVTLVKDVEIAPNGDVWVLTSNTITRFDGTDWTVYAEGQGFEKQYFFDSLLIDPQGVIWANHGGGLVVFGDGVWAERSSGGFITPRGMAADLAGTVYVGTFSQGLLAYDQSTWGMLETSSSQVEDVAVDENGRIWAATEYGINVFDGETTHIYRMDNANMSSNRIVSLAIVNGGPALPAPIEKAPGSMTGFFTLDGTAYADAIVEICVEELYSSFNGETPCEEQPYSQQSTTNSDGVFTFTDVPVGLYSIVVQTEDGWAKYTGEFGLGSEFVQIVEGEETEVGELILTSEEDE